jgi:hypothetical protein
MALSSGAESRGRGTVGEVVRAGRRGLSLDGCPVVVGLIGGGRTPVANWVRSNSITLLMLCGCGCVGRIVMGFVAGAWRPRRLW